MNRKCKDWLKSYIDYTQHTETPTHLHFWAGVSTIAACLRRKVYIDEVFYKWYPSFYIVFVADPGIVSKSTTTSIGYNLLKEIPSINIGADSFTSRSIIDAFIGCEEKFFVSKNLSDSMSAISFNVSELGTMLDVRDRQLINWFIKLYDGENIRTETKNSGVSIINNPFCNFIAGTTPAWINSNFTDNVVNGGLASRILFVYADKKKQSLAYPSQHVQKGLKLLKAELVHDLHLISQMCGEFKLSDDAITLGTTWYENHTAKQTEMTENLYGGYFARKQSHIHKLAMVISASENNELIISDEHLNLAITMVTDLERDMMKVFDGVNQPEIKKCANEIMKFIAARSVVSYEQLYNYFTMYVSYNVSFESVLTKLINDGNLRLKRDEKGDFLEII